MTPSKKTPARKTAEKEDRPLSAMQRKFVEIHASGVPAGRSYERAGYKARGSIADQKASRLLATNGKAKEYLEELKEEASEDCRWSKKQAMDYLVDVLETPIGEVDTQSKFAQSHQEGTERAGEKITMPGKMDALGKLISMCGWEAPKKTENTNRETKEVTLSPEAIAELERIQKIKTKIKPPDYKADE